MSHINLFSLFFLTTIIFYSCSKKTEPSKIDSSAYGPDDILPFYIVEEKPKFPNGEAAMLQFIMSNINYPRYEKDNEIEGIVFLEFVIKKDGSISDVKIVRSLTENIDKEAIRIVKMMPKWKPGILDGQTRNTSVRLPIRFQLDY